MSAAWAFADRTALAIDAECFETPDEPIDLIVEREILTSLIIDPCCGRGQMVRNRALRNHHVIATDKHDWGFSRESTYADPPPLNFLSDAWNAHVDGHGWSLGNATMMINPPFSLACDFIRKGFALGVRKILCYQRFAWYEGNKRRDFWREFPPNRIYVTEGRWDCWRIDIPPAMRGVPKSKGGAGTSRPYPHAWYVWERGQPSGTLLGRLERDR
jgi:hypothetical protein